MAMVYLSLGSNIDREKSIESCMRALRQQFTVLAVSSVYESEAVGFDGENFYNLVVAIETGDAVGQLLAKLRQIEDDNGRLRGGERFSARTLDIDILTYDELTGVVDDIELPRDEILTSAFVLWPLAEIGPQQVHPLSQKTYQQMWQDFDKDKQQLWVADFKA